ncbi:hypothetical protein MTR67_030197 [Solanum verrucosum]|nr:hypothetical protein MTR67_030197 [Solanum verrucosum]
MESPAFTIPQTGLVFLTLHRLHDSSRSARKNQFRYEMQKGACGIQSAASCTFPLNCSLFENLQKKMANARIARFVTEVAPPQFVNVMRNRASKMLETIKEEEKEASTSESLSLKSYSPSSSSAYSASSSNVKSSKYFLKEVQRSFSVFGS